MSGNPGLHALGEQIQQRILDEGESLDQVEAEVINTATGLNDDQRAGLWLWAWSLQSAAHQRYEAKSFLRQLEIAEKAGRNEA